MLKNQKGFTLIEIISVLVILGILAAVAVPKFIDMQTKSKDSALAGALAEGMSAVSTNYAYLMLSNGGTATTTALIAKVKAAPPASGDFSYTFALSGNDVRVTVGAKGTAGALGTYTSTKGKTWAKPS